MSERRRGDIVMGLGSSHWVYMLYEDYLLWKAKGVCHLYEVEEWLELLGK